MVAGGDWHVSRGYIHLAHRLLLITSETGFRLNYVEKSPNSLVPPRNANPSLSMCLYLCDSGSKEGDRILSCITTIIWNCNAPLCRLGLTYDDTLPDNLGLLYVRKSINFELLFISSGSFQR
jgi:hypothetical protein